ncbi:universal stress protein [Salibacterium halotolerans]|uniref:Universal stress protein n=1 Tax=Salibacterium halotolerans TaxID=1884432 RepID=A0A1I5VI16_9BACI|nr:universal stress protein [Salibacterium halotolerans]SFQ06987.1 Nucleotide-binding universal stress protein, UspA family [Salibacterium halotolerans]
MTVYKNILVAADGSRESKTALNKAVDMALDHQAALIIVHIIDTRTFATIEQYDRTVVSRAEEYGRELVEQFRKEAEQAGVEKVSTVIDFGSPRVKIPKDIARKHEVDLIMTGATGLNTVERILIGSVSEGVARQAECDVLIVRS